MLSLVNRSLKIPQIIGLLSRANSKSNRGPERKSLEAPYIGPYKVLKRGPKTFTLQIQNKESVVTIDRLKPAYLTNEEQYGEKSSTPTPLTSPTPSKTPPNSSSQAAPERKTRSGRVIARVSQRVSRDHFSTCHDPSYNIIIFVRGVDVNQKRLKLFGDDISPPVRFVKMTALELKVPLEFIEIDLFKRENMSQTYTAINPLQKVPALAVGKDIMVDSHSIAMYLCDAFDKKDVLYSKDPVKRSKINEMLFYNSCYLFPIDSNMFCEFFESGKPVSDQKRESWYKALDYLNNKLEYSPYLAGGDRYSLADLCCMATITSTQLIVPPNQRHTKLHDWMEKMLSSPCFEVNLVGLEKLYCHVQKIQPKPINH